MTLEEVRKYCLSKPGAEESFPFGEDTLVFKVGGKIFAISSFDIPVAINLKCEPEYAIELRERYEEIQPGYHMNKMHWNTVNAEGRIPESFIKKLIDHSYDLIVKKLPNNKRENLKK